MLILDQDKKWFYGSKKDHEGYPGDGVEYAFAIPEAHAEAFKELCKSCLKAHESGLVIDGEAALYLGKKLWSEIFEEKK